MLASHQKLAENQALVKHLLLFLSGKEIFNSEKADGVVEKRHQCVCKCQTGASYTHRVDHRTHIKRFLSFHSHQQYLHETLITISDC